LQKQTLESLFLHITLKASRNRSKALRRNAMSKLVHAMYAALIAAPLIGVATDTAAQGVAGAARAAGQAGQGAQSGGGQSGAPGAMGGGGGGGFRGGGFRDRDNFRFRGGFYGGFGPGFGFYDPWYDPFWGPRFSYGYYGYYPYDYYPPPTRVIVRERNPEPGYLPPPNEPPPEQNWYRCDNPQGFYPYVRNCNGPWQSVPVAPPNAPGPPQR
jgi:hypothetical protein